MEGSWRGEPKIQRGGGGGGFFGGGGGGGVMSGGEWGWVGVGSLFDNAHSLNRSNKSIFYVKEKV